MSSFGAETVGDNIEFTANAIGDYIIVFNATGIDTEFTKYPTANTQTARKFEIRCDKSTDLVGINSIDFTDPCQITADKAHIENRNVPVINKIKLRTNSTITLIKVRWF